MGEPGPGYTVPSVAHRIQVQNKISKPTMIMCCIHGLSGFLDRVQDTLHSTAVEIRKLYRPGRNVETPIWPNSRVLVTSVV